MNPFLLGPWTVVPDRNQLVAAGETRNVEPKAMELLVRLAAAPNVVVSKEELLRDVWRDAHVVEHVLPKTVSALRKALGDDAQTARFIQTIPKRGYVLAVAPVPLAATRRHHRTPLAIATALAIVIAAAVLTLQSEPRHTLGLAPTRAADANAARDAEDALAHDLAKFSCLAVTKKTARAEYRVESNLVDVAGQPSLRTRLVHGDAYVAAIDTPANDGVVNASPTAAARLVKHVCKRR